MKLKTDRLTHSQSNKLSTADIAILGMLGALMFASKALMDMLPNIHLIAVFICACTRVYRAKALYPIYIFVLLCGIFEGFTTWWIPYLYIWTILWGAVMILPKNIKPKYQPFIFATVAGLHGFLFGTLFAPAQAIFFGLNFKQTIAWIGAGLSFDAIHGISNVISGLILTYPIITLMQRISAMSPHKHAE